MFSKIQREKYLGQKNISQCNLAFFIYKSEYFVFIYFVLHYNGLLIKCDFRFQVLTPRLPGWTRPIGSKIDFTGDPIFESARWFFIFILKFIFTSIFEIKIHEKNSLTRKKFHFRTPIFISIIFLTAWEFINAKFIANGYFIVKYIMINIYRFW